MRVQIKQCGFLRGERCIAPIGSAQLMTLDLEEHNGDLVFAKGCSGAGELGWQMECLGFHRGRASGSWYERVEQTDLPDILAEWPVLIHMPCENSCSNNQPPSS